MKTSRMTVIWLLIFFSFIPASWAETKSVDSVPVILAKLIIDPLCIESEEVCRKKAEKQEALRQRCADNPAWCEQQRNIKRERRELRRQCKAQPDKCEELTRQFKERRAKERQEMRQDIKAAQKQWCENNPRACEQWKADLKELQKKCRELRLEIQEKYDVPR